ncbi:hypothetical protein OKA05_25070 [Luteolibacter arcticus]|uniref:Uncharacterized protein n=1 Tax=Luteolibacter arcticus TaxID=1581411 RepID=A0ABT3GQQ4_9BACT|nr:hypothetical protein [Luteolibacter arcticus]MCW1925855.1 hypothetical protein [Luteolibacter arcticus]
MKKLLLRAFALVVAVLPLTVAEAAPKPKPPKIFGGFAVGETFTFTVTNKTVAATQGTTPVVNPVVPAGVPNYTVGQQVTFTVGKKGELVAPGLKIKFLSESVVSNAYANKPKKGAQPNAAIVHKDTESGDAIGVSLAFFTVKVTKRVPNVNQVTYTLE